MNKIELLQAAKPILFNTQMVQAIMNGRKTVTRRGIKPQPQNAHTVLDIDDGKALILCGKIDGKRCLDWVEERKLPYLPNDYLYVRETWARILNEYAYRCEYANCDIELPTHYEIVEPKWRPSIHMPKEAARLFLRVTDVRVEQLQDITEESAESEGAPCMSTPWVAGVGRSYRQGFGHTWDEIYDSKHLDRYEGDEKEYMGWSDNPWVWVIEFERIEVLNG